jgi:choline-glycine betaine transporter
MLNFQGAASPGWASRPSHFSYDGSVRIDKLQDAVVIRYQLSFGPQLVIVAIAGGLASSWALLRDGMSVLSTIPLGMTILIAVYLAIGGATLWGFRRRLRAIAEAVVS